ncbi:MAG: hemerythrin domain-containing protein [Pseudomonadota bacterium]
MPALDESTSRGGPAPRPARDPIDLLLRDHRAFRAMCDRIDRIVDDPSSRASRDAAVWILIHGLGELRFHAGIEDDALIPLLRARCEPADGIDRICAQLGRHHQAERGWLERLANDLERVARGEAPARPLQFIHSASDYTETERRHLDWEEMNLFPLARRRLTSADRQAVVRAIDTARGIERIAASPIGGGGVGA